MFTSPCKKRKNEDADDEHKSKPRIEDPVVADKVKVVCKAMLDAPGCSGWCHEMLVSIVPGALSPSKCERDIFQREGVEMVGKVLNTLEGELAINVEQLQNRIKRAPDDVTKLEQARDVANQKQVSARKARDAAAAKASKVSNTVREAHAALAEAQAVYKSLKAREAELLAEKAGRTDAYHKHFVPLATWEFVGKGSVDDHLKPLLDACQGSSFEPSLLAAFPLAVKLHPEKRAKFDKCAVERMEEILKTDLEEVDNKLAEFTPIVDDSVRTAEAHLAAARELEREAQQAAEEALKKQQAAEEAYRMAHQNVEDFPTITLKAEQDLKALQARLSDLENGPVAAYNWLKDRNF